MRDLCGCFICTLIGLSRGISDIRMDYMLAYLYVWYSLIGGGGGYENTCMSLLTLVLIGGRV